MRFGGLICVMIEVRFADKMPHAALPYRKALIGSLGNESL